MAIIPRERVTLVFRNAALIYKNFAGEKRQFNNEGDMNFSLLLDEEQAQELLRDVNHYGNAWNVKPLKRRSDEDEQLHHLKVSINFDNKPPRIFLISSGGRLKLPKDMVGILDKLESARIDLTIVAFDWEVNGNTGRKAYLENLFFHLYENELDVEYADVPEMPALENGMQRAIESGSRQDYDYEGEEVPN